MNKSTKNDVLIGPEYAVWSPGQNPNDRVNNWFYDDIPQDGGYNHFELRRYKRAYTDGPGGFVQGQLAPPMEEAADWVKYDVFGGQ